MRWKWNYGDDELYDVLKDTTIYYRSRHNLEVEYLNGSSKAKSLTNELCVQWDL